MRGMATKEEIARYGWVRSAVLGALLLVIALVISDGQVTAPVLILSVGGVALIAYAATKRARDRAAAGL